MPVKKTRSGVKPIERRQPSHLAAQPFIRLVNSGEASLPDLGPARRSLVVRRARKNVAGRQAVVVGMLRYEMVPLSSLFPNPKNARKHSKRQIEQIADSIVEFGWPNPILAAPNNMIVAGHGRWEAAKILDLEAVPVLFADKLSPAELRAYAVADNRLHDESSFDLELVALELDSLRLEMPEFEISITGFSEAEVDKQLGATRTAELNDLDDPELLYAEREPVSMLGDEWHLREHLVVCGDSTDTEIVARAVRGRTVRLVLSDTPYNLKIAGLVSGLGRKVHPDFRHAAGELSPEEYIAFLQRAMAAFRPHLFDGALVLLFIDWRHVAEMLAAGAASDLDLKNILVWAKDNAGMGSLWRSQHELIVAFKHGTAPHVNNVELGKHGRHRSNLLQYPGMNSFGKGRATALEAHATVKPVALIADLILDVSNRGDLIFDGFAGTGTALIAAEKTGRIASLVEIEPTFVDIAIERWEALTGQWAIHADGRTFAEVRAARAHESGEAGA